MEKGRIVEMAPVYYAMAIVKYISREKKSYTYRGEVDTGYTSGGYKYLSDNQAYLRGCQHAVELGCITIEEDDFGPDIYIRSEQFDEIIAKLEEDIKSPWGKYRVTGHNWLLNALVEVNKQITQQGVTQEDFSKTDHEWEPIPLERADADLQRVQDAFEKTVEELRSDNGYGVAHPEEKAYVLDKLKLFIDKLKSASSISWMYIKTFGVDPLLILVKRFGSAAIGISAAAAGAALSEWLKKKGISILDTLLK